ncbi:hypothetical protein [Allorhodopirellula solitaria]|uniref:Sulfatase n=1 Tax=Allorhodopirellula solitaria TaxID=2527987 RepID=A0A5C5XQF8_9BACT|nr:hypothetical protein [Allorhodopirellula solitaria]TWT64643.1 hypothetical protein CA85_37760 [Allorhodopirellula solitaria]
MLLLTLEGFAPAALSCYGSSWNRTESIDALSATGTTWDRVVTPVADPVRQLDRWLSHDRFPAHDMVVVTDDERLSKLPSADAIGELIVIPPPADGRVADTMEETLFASLAAIAAEQLADNPHVWLHSRFLTRGWDAPRDLFPVDQLDEADLEPLDASESLEREFADAGELDGRSNLPAIFPDWQPPHFALEASDDPDLVMAWMRTYGCQIRLIDALFGLLHDVAPAAGQDAIVLAGTSGFSLGQNGAVGHRAGPLRSCHLQVPLIASSFEAGISGVGIRNPNVTSADRLPDLIATLANRPTRSPLSPEAWAARQPQEDASAQDGILTSLGERNVAVTTQDWFFVAGGAGAESDAISSEEDVSSLGHLFLKPDDLCDVNDVARLKVGTSTQFSELLQDS